MGKRKWYWQRPHTWGRGSAGLRHGAIPAATSAPRPACGARGSGIRQATYAQSDITEGLTVHLVHGLARPVSQGSIVSQSRGRGVEETEHYTRFTAAPCFMES